MTPLGRVARAAVRLLDRLPAGSGAPKLYWRYRHLVEGSEWISGYFDSQNDPRRQALAAHVVDVPHGRSCLEVGCNSGANLGVLAGMRPDWELLGIDINKKAIDVGRRLFSQAGVTNITLRQGTAEDLTWLATDAVDVAFSDAALMYVAPHKLDRALDEMARVATKRLILNEFLTQEHRRSALGGYWAHDYVEWAQRHGLAFEVIESPRASVGGNWSLFGHLMRIHLT